MSHQIIYIMGVAGSGKTTIGKKLASKLDLPFFDGDDFHSPANKQKMGAGIPLNDEDRAGWLTRLNELAREQLTGNGAVIACSALKDGYRKMLSNGIAGGVYWIFLQGSYELIRRRMEERSGHYMKPSMLSSQFDALEIPSQALTMDISLDPDEIVSRILAAMKEIK